MTPWHPGSIARCIRDDWETLCPGYVRHGDEPRKGQFLTVDHTLAGAQWLVFEADGGGYEACAFVLFAAAADLAVAA